LRGAVLRRGQGRAVPTLREDGRIAVAVGSPVMGLVGKGCRDRGLDRDSLGLMDSVGLGAA